MSDTNGMSEASGTDRGVLVTGASRGIGRAVAEAFARNGDRVAVHYGSRRADAEQTRDALAGSGHTLVGGELGDPESAERIAREAESALGGIDVLVNNAGIMRAHPVADSTYAQWRTAWESTLGVNLFAAANLSYLVARGLIERDAPGWIVNIGSRGAFRGEPDSPAYGASKAALHALGQSLAVSLAPHRISVTSVAPGFVATEMLADRYGGADSAGTERIKAQSPFGRIAEPAEIAAAVTYLASPEARWSSGAVLDVNGASYLRT
ncbi:SDR family NAD(P)-dependent oxidoreductase [Sciscionella sediminilitoris]|uniref:SDR family NAD(P)-dependent oxidoreductase n=1 Tax=Sciscionella sediminilitoris TaxID=1445613 RepID=UPI00068A6EC1|nr:SDR family oxidoreductase [Sciscionella sp. SE31]